MGFLNFWIVILFSWQNAKVYDKPGEVHQDQFCDPGDRIDPSQSADALLSLGLPDEAIRALLRLCVAFYSSDRELNLVNRSVMAGLLIASEFHIDRVKRNFKLIDSVVGRGMYMFFMGMVITEPSNK